MSKNNGGDLCFSVHYRAPSFALPDFSTTTWKSIYSLPELSPTYSDALWTPCNHTTSTNDQLGLLTPTSLYASDYGYHTGSLLYRGHFVSTGHEESLFLNTSGGTGYAHSVWLNTAYLGYWAGNGGNATWSQTLPIAPGTVQEGKKYVFTVLIDHMGQTEEPPGTDSIKFPFGILNYHLSGHEQSDVRWKMTGNLGGEEYRDHVRGPRNEGALYAERQGYHLPDPPTGGWEVRSPFDGVEGAGVRFYSTSFDLDVPVGWDAPMSFIFNNGTYGGGGKEGDYGVELFVNGYQFGRYGKHYLLISRHTPLLSLSPSPCPHSAHPLSHSNIFTVHNLGPQTTYPVPEGILNYSGRNWIGLTLWAQNPSGAKLDSLELVPQMPVMSGFRRPGLAPQPKWKLREGAY